MSHFIVIVDTTDKHYEDLLAPYDEEITVAPYDVDCYCLGREAKDQINEQLVSEFGNDGESFGQMFDRVFRKPYWAYKRKPKWENHIEPLTDRENQLKEEFAVALKEPVADCEDCNGTGKRTSTYNPNSKWDWYSVGGRWSGYLPLKESHGGGGADIARLEEIDRRKLTEPFAFVDRNGVWYERAEMGWWGMTANERDDEYQTEWKDWLKGLSKDTELVAIDCHI